MNVLIVIRSKIPVFSYGGTQRVMWSLGKELALMGHKVSFLAAEGSTCPFGKMYIYNPDIPVADQIPEDVDVVHFNDFVPDGFDKKPYIVTFHGNRINEPINKNAVFVSANHAKRFNSESFVYNGLDWRDYGKVDISGSRDYFHFLAKAAWRVKNVRGSIDMIKQIPNEQLYVLGGYRFNFKMGMRFTFTPKARFKGMVGGEEKINYLTHSKGLFFPVLWDEPFGLAIIESLYCGAPVFATTYGSLPELVREDVGFLSNSKEELIRHIVNDYHYSPKVCHEYAAEMFSSKVMADAYLKKYEQVLSGNVLNAELPRAIAPNNRYKFE